MTFEQDQHLRKLARELSEENNKHGLTDKVKQLHRQYYETEAMYNSEELNNTSPSVTTKQNN